jgi:RNA polymerase sigma-70 factor (ECF subfamily)
MSEKDDVEIIEECLRGHVNAFGLLVDKYQKQIFNGALRMIIDVEDAEDVAQTVFIKAFENLKAFNSQYRFFSWLYRILVNECLNFIKHRKHVRELNLESMPGTDRQSGNQEIIDLHQDIQNALTDLQPDYRMVIVLKHFQDFSYSEMSHILDIPEKTVKSRLYTARQLLKDILTRKGFVAHVE